MARPLVSDETWEEISPLLPGEFPRSKGGRPRLSDRAALTGILFVLKTGISWEQLPHEMGCGSGMTCLRRLRDWQQAGVWDGIRTMLDRRMRGAEEINWPRAGRRRRLSRGVADGVAGTGKEADRATA